VTVHNLKARYPDLRVDTEYEQRLLLEHDTIVLQFPFHWHSTPAIVKEWQDAVLAYGFAYGAHGDKLRGKKLMIATTTGGPRGLRGRRLQPVHAERVIAAVATANLAGMRYEPFFAVSGARA
jgi:glutathione-regulated potassium-efflux system ancillary protein KefG